MISIKQPKYSTREVLVGCYHVQDGDNIISLYRAGDMNGMYLMTSDEICSYPLGSNGVIDCWLVPLDRLLECRVGDIE